MKTLQIFVVFCRLKVQEIWYWWNDNIISIILISIGVSLYFLVGIFEPLGHIHFSLINKNGFERWVVEPIVVYIVLIIFTILIGSLLIAIKATSNWFISNWKKATEIVEDNDA